MAYYAALVSLVQSLENIIRCDQYQNLLLHNQKIAPVYEKFILHKQQIAPLYEKFSLLQALLADYLPKDREATGFLERRIRDVAYRTQDIIEFRISNQMLEYLSEKNQMPQQLQDIAASQISNQVCQKDKTHGVNRILQRLISAFQKAVPRCEDRRLYTIEKECRELQKVKEEVNSIIQMLMRIKKSHTTEDFQLNYCFVDARTSDKASARNTMEGFEERQTMIKDQLCGEPSKLRAVSIVGMGGIGKTTLARNIFDDELIVYKFDCRAWVTVSQDYHLQNVLLDILDSMNVITNRSSGVGELGEKIYKHLKGRRYLIIMDDMWDTKVWNDMKRILPDDSSGSRIMITTRISDVAFYVDKFGFYHQMQFLNEDQSWNLFCEKVFCPPELEDIGRLIAKNCGGLPLAIVVVAGLLSKINNKRSDWEDIARNVSLAAAENDKHFSNILSLSYNQLPHHLKPLFLYIGGFPEDYEIRISKLVKLWIAEGFLKPIESKSLEAVAEEYLEDLVNRNLVLITKKKSNGKIKCCGIHDVLRDLCTEINSYENFLHVVHKDYYFHPKVARNVRRLYIRNFFLSPSNFTRAKKFGSHARSIISDNSFWEFSLFRSGFKLLRVLDAKGRLSSGILKLFHLRYLALIYDCEPNIPPSISQLQNLQTLIIGSSGKIMFCSLPSQIVAMPNLRHIVSSRNLHFKCQFFDRRIVGEPLENLQALSWVNNAKFTNKVVGMIPNLRKLKVSCDEIEAVGWQKFGLDNLFYLRHLETLNIEFPDIWRHRVNPLPESFVFPLTLTKLSLRECRLPWKDMMVMGSLPNLQVLKLRDSAFVGEKWELIEVKFPQLKFLLMEGLELKYWQAENIHFPTLQHLKISYCWKLQEIPFEIGEISTLELVEVHYSELAAKSALKMQEEQRDMGNDVLQVRVYHFSNFRFPNKESYSNKELQEEAVGSKDEIQEEDGSDRGDELREINPVN